VLFIETAALFILLGAVLALILRKKMSGPQISDKEFRK
jgi:hypothetical protein